jgi:thiosulfate/3-mercaptopyruvate sulfurtransferase
MSGLDFVQTALSYWHGALSEPVLIIGREEMQRAAAAGAIIWDVRTAEEAARHRLDGALALGDVDWLLADNSGGNLIPATVIADTLAKAGIEPGRTVVIYAEQRAVDAFVALRALRSIGIDDAQVCLAGASLEATSAAATAAATATASAPAPASAVGGRRSASRATAPSKSPIFQPA